MGRVCALICVVALLVGGAGYAVLVGAQEKAAPTLTNFRLRTLAGDEITLDSPELSGERVAFCFLASWSELGQAQARQVLKYRSALDGKIVFVCQGNERDVRDVRSELGAESDVWLKSESQVASKFAEAFDDISSLDRVPALVVADATRRVVHASVGELSDDDIREALSSRVN